jgi:hypothetical protein
VRKSERARTGFILPVELGVIIGKRGKLIPASKAMEHVGGTGWVQRESESFARMLRSKQDTGTAQHEPDSPVTSSSSFLPRPSPASKVLISCHLIAAPMPGV